jgi:hypothetical protein
VRKLFLYEGVTYQARTEIDGIFTTAERANQRIDEEKAKAKKRTPPLKRYSKLVAKRHGSRRLGIKMSGERVPSQMAGSGGAVPCDQRQRRRMEGG